MDSPNEITITNLECVVTKLRLEPGDCLVVCVDKARSQEQLNEVGRSFEEAFGVPVIALPEWIKLEAVLNCPPELIERAKELGRKRVSEDYERIREQFAPKEVPCASTSR